MYFDITSILHQRRVKLMDIQLGDILKLKKQHPCGSSQWEVLRVGADFRLKWMWTSNYVT